MDAGRRHRRLIRRYGRHSLSLAFDASGKIVQGWARHRAFDEHRERRLDQLGDTRSSIPLLVEHYCDSQDRISAARSGLWDEENLIGRQWAPVACTPPHDLFRSEVLGGLGITLALRGGDLAGIVASPH